MLVANDELLISDIKTAILDKLHLIYSIDEIRLIPMSSDIRSKALIIHICMVHDCKGSNDDKI